MRKRNFGLALGSLAVPVLALSLACAPVPVLAEEPASADAEVAMDSGYLVNWTQDGTCVWAIDASGVLTIKPADGKGSGELENSAWTDSDYAEKITAVKVEGKVKAPANFEKAFRGLSSAKTMDLSGLDTSNVESMFGMFYYCKSLTSLDVSGFNTSKVTNMFRMFSYLPSLTSLDLSNFDTSKVTNMSAMFMDSSALKTLDISSFDTSNVEYMNNMFPGCDVLTTVKLGAKFSFKGNVSLPAGSWKSSADGKSYPAAKVPSNVASTYVRTVGTDVDDNTPHVNDIFWLVSEGISTGFEDGTFRPYNAVARCDMAAFLYRMAGSPSYTAPSTSPFKDCDSKTPHYKEICWLYAKGISKGFGDGTFRPYATVARCDMAAFLYRMAGSPSYTAPSKSLFKDCDTETPHYKEVCWLASEGISEGWSVSGGKEFRPYNNVARADMAAFLHRM